MKIEKPEDIDLLFKNKINELPIDFQEANWSDLSQKLDKAMPLSNTSFGMGGSIIKFILISVGILASCLAVYWFNFNTSTSPSIPVSDTKSLIELKQTISNLNVPLKEPSLEEKKSEKETVINTKVKEQKKPISSEIPLESKFNKEDTLIHIFW